MGEHPQCRVHQVGRAVGLEGRGAACMAEEMGEACHEPRLAVLPCAHGSGRGLACCSLPSIGQTSDLTSRMAEDQIEPLDPAFGLPSMLRSTASVCTCGSYPPTHPPSRVHEEGEASAQASSSHHTGPQVVVQVTQCELGGGTRAVAAQAQGQVIVLRVMQRSRDEELTAHIAHTSPGGRNHQFCCFLFSVVHVSRGQAGMQGRSRARQTRAVHSYLCDGGDVAQGLQVHGC